MSDFDEPLSAFLIDLGAKIRAARKARGLSQRALATAMRIDRANVRKYEKGQLNVGSETLLKIATALDADLRIEFVIGPTDEPPK